MDACKNIVELTALSSLYINPRQPARIKNARGLRLRVEAGSIWVTQHGCFDDIYVRAGDSYCIERDGLTLISAVNAPFALVTLDPSIPLRPSLSERWWTLWASLCAPQSHPTSAAL